jgi:outer membrane receptor protein involved in Fe transport
VAPPPPYYPIYKDWSGQLDRWNTSVTESERFSFSANGDLFEGGSWTWDAYVSHGTSENETEVDEYPSGNRANMATDAVFQFGANPADPNAEIVCRVDYDDPNNPNDTGDLVRAQWVTFLTAVLADQGDQAQLYYDTLSEGCEPLNPFGLAASREALAYAFPSIFEGADNEQNSLSFLVSGDAWRGIGTAGPMRMAAGLDYSEDTTRNFTFPGRNEILARDFALNFGDPWAGVTENQEAWVEFDLPLMSDRPAVEYLALNLSDRFTRNESERLTGTPSPNRNDVSSWKASMVWQPVEFMRVRITRSSDTRAPSARELYQVNSPSANSFSRQQVSNPFVLNDPNTTDNESTDLYRSGTVGGNTQLSEERAINETVGVVFTPTELLAGLQLSIDYYETSITGGIDDVGANQVLGRCRLEVDAGLPPEERGFCNSIEWNPPRTDLDPSLIVIPEYSDINVINASQENTEPFWSRGIDFSVNYTTQLSGGGLISARMLTTRFLEQSVDLGGWWGRRNVAGQTGSNGLANIFGGLGINYSPTPDISGDVSLTYTRNAFSLTGEVRYTGSGKLNLQESWIGPGETGYYRQINNDSIQFSATYNPTLENTTNQPDLPSWTILNLSFNFDFGRSALSLDRFESLSAYLNINNVGDQIPTFFSGTGAGGLNTTFYSAMGREYRLGMRMEF